MSMEGVKMTTALTIVVVLMVATQMNNSLAKSLKTVVKDEGMVETMKACVEACSPGDFECPMKCLKDTASKDEDSFLKILKESQNDVRSVYCDAGCAATDFGRIIDPNEPNSFVACDKLCTS